MKQLPYLLLTCLIVLIVIPGHSQNNNGVIDDINELFQKRTVNVETPDGALLATDIYLPITTDSLVVNVDIPLIGNINLELIQKGVQYITYPTLNGEPNPNPYELPMVLTRTPYSKEQVGVLGYVFAALGYATVLQDTRGLYSSTDLFIPLYTDSWDKTPYSDFIPYTILPDGYTEGGIRNPSAYEDGNYCMDFVLNDLTRDYDIDNDGVTDFTGTVGNGSIFVFGASALSNSSLQMALSRKTDPFAPGLKGFLNLIATTEYWSHVIFNNCVYHQGLVEDWVRFQVNDFYENWEVTDETYENSIHTPSDYGLNNIQEVVDEMMNLVSETIIDGKAGLYPDGVFRQVYDASRAPVDEDGTGNPNGAYSRYQNLDMPFYQVSGWWDIFVSGQIETWKQIRKHISEEGGNRSKQKLVIGPWQHYYPALRNAGDITFPENVSDVLGVTVDFDGELDLDFLVSLLQLDFEAFVSSELFSFFRYATNYNSYKNVGEPRISFPANLRYQDLPGNFLIQLPAEDFETTHANLINWIAGLESLNGFVGKVYRVNGADTTLANTIDFNLPPLPPVVTNIFGDLSEPLEAFPVYTDFEELPDVRMYICGPNGPGVPPENQVGNYWMEADTFPLVDGRTWNKLYLHSDGSINDSPPETEEEAKSYVHDPNDPVVTVAGNNLSITAPDGKDAMGPRNLALPELAEVSVNRDDVLIFQTEKLEDSLTVIGFPTIALYGSSMPEGASAGDPTDTDFMVRIVDVYPGGAEYQITEAVVNARAREYVRSVAEDREDDFLPLTNIESGDVYEYKFRAFPMGYTFAKNHRIKILVSSSNYPKHQSNPNIPLEDDEYYRWRPGNAGNYEFEGQTYQPRKATNAIHFSPEYPSRIELPVFGRQVAVCAAPNILSTEGITDSTALVRWSGVTGADRFTLRYRLVGEDDWVVVDDLPGFSLQLEQLASGSAYEWSVGSYCDGDTVYSDIEQFESTGVPVFSTVSFEEQFGLYPNPATERISVSVKNAMWSGIYRLIDASGKVVLEESMNTAIREWDIEVSQLGRGNYWLELESVTGERTATPIVLH